MKINKRKVARLKREIRAAKLAIRIQAKVEDQADKNLTKAVNRAGRLCVRLDNLQNQFYDYVGPGAFTL
jgi:hypothetical protein